MPFEYDRCLHYNGDVRDSFVLGQQFGMNTRTRRIYRVEHVTYDPNYHYDPDFRITYREGRSTVYLKFATEEDFLRWNPAAQAAMAATSTATAKSNKTQRRTGRR
jgi:hypothetical protein